MSSQIPWQRGQSKTKVPLGPERPKPECPHCGAVGHTTTEFAAYVWCKGDPANHQRNPIR